jgi:hypothetical protein
MKIEIWDENNEVGASDNLIGCIPVRFSRIMQKVYDEPFWQNIYGAPVNNDKKITQEMNANPEIASNWKGRVLMQIEHHKQLTQKFMVQKIP